MEYDFRKIEKDWQKNWKESNAYKVNNDSPKPKYYVLDMFPYPSGTGLHVGHPLGYIASDIYARYKRLKGFNVLHPMGYDAFGLPAEQYAIDHGIHPAISTENNINNFRKQLDNIGFSFDWDREVRTSDPKYYKWTQWIFLELFHSFYNRRTNKAEKVDVLINAFEKEGNVQHTIPNSQFLVTEFTADQWKSFDEKTQQDILMQYRLAYCGYGEVNWCEALGTVLANDEVVNGVSERGGHPVVKKKLRQWYLRITEYADRLLEGLQKVDFSEAMKEMQSNWIGKSSGAEMEFAIKSQKPEAGSLRVYTTRPDTVFGVDFMVIAPELDIVEKIKSAEQTAAVDEYLAYVKSRSERERMAEKKISGVFTGSYAINPFDGREIPIWISEYVLAGYGTGAIMAVPCGDERDLKFAKHFNIPVTNIIGSHFNGEEANPTKDAILENSGFINGMVMREAIDVVIKKIEEMGIGVRKVNYKMRDAAFSRQRYWGEPFPIIWENGIAYPLDESELPLELPHVESYKPGPEGEGPLANIKEWALIPNPSPQVEKGAARVPKYSVHTPVQYELAKQLRKGFTEAENELWQLVRDSKLSVKFRRQHPIDRYIVDFICLQEKLIVEVDGGYHANEEQKKYDEERTKVLNDIGFEVIRFTNEEVMKDVFIVRNKIKAKLAELASNSPLRLRRGVGGEEQAQRETNTMPGYAGSSWYFLRYMDPHNDQEFCNRKVSDYWGQVDLYIGGTEHAVGHLLYSRMWTKALYDLGYIGHDEPYKKLVNQGMIQGSSRFVYRLNNNGIEDILKHLINTEFKEYAIVPCDFDKPETNFHYRAERNGFTYFLEVLRYDEIPQAKEKYESSSPDSSVYIFLSTDEILCHYIKNDLKDWMSDILESEKNYYSEIYHKALLFISWNKDWDEYSDFIYDKIHVDVNLVNGAELDVEAFRKWRDEYENAEFTLEDGKYVCGILTEKMSKRLYNTVNPDDLVLKYGADTFRMYEMFLGPVEMSKPWDTKGIEGVHRFLKKLWRLFYDEVKGKVWNEEKATDAELKVLHRAIKQIEEVTERFSFNTGVSGFMIAVNELSDLKCHKKEVLEKLLILLTPYAPHVAEELWHQLGNNGSILDAAYPVYDPKYLIESSKEYPISVNGKLRTTMNIALDAAQPEVEKIVLENEVIQKWLDGKSPKKIIFVKGKMVNIVV